MNLQQQLSLFGAPPDTAGRRLRRLAIGNRVIDYELRQAAGRRLAMSIDERGLRVGAPKSLALAAIERFVLDHADWVLDKLDEYAVRGAPRHLTIRHGVLLPVLGDEVTVGVVAGGNRCRWTAGGLELAARADADLNALARRGLQQRALQHFRTRAEALALPLARPLPRLALSSARTRWGSCSAATGIRIHWRLIHLPPRCADYVIAHELAHLVHMNHGERFWRLVGELYADWRSVRQELRSLAPTIPIV